MASSPEQKLMETTVTLSTAIKKRLADLQYQLRAERGRVVTYNEVLEYLMDAREELVKRVAAEYEGGV